MGETIILKESKEEAVLDTKELKTACLIYAKNHFQGKHFINKATNRQIIVSSVLSTTDCKIIAADLGCDLKPQNAAIMGLWRGFAAKKRAQRCGKDAARCCGQDTSDGLGEWQSKSESREQILSIKKLDSLLEESTQQSVKPDTAKRYDINEFAYFSKDIEINGISFEAIITIKNTKQGGDKYYHHYLKDIKLEPRSGNRHTSDNSASDAPLLRGSNDNMPPAHSDGRNPQIDGLGGYSLSPNSTDKSSAIFPS